MNDRLDPDVATARNLVRAATADLPGGGRVLVALSGGQDSLALAAATAFVAQRAEWEAGAVVVDHRLQDGSRGIAESAAGQARALGLGPVQVVGVAVDPSSPRGPEGAAREARYAALSDAAQRHDAAAVLLAHTLDDQAETVLMGLARGSGARTLAAMAPVDGLWRRPLLGLSRRQTRRVCEASGLRWWSDPHNDDDAYTRVRVRADALPALEDALGPGVREALARTASLVRADADHLDVLAARAYADTADGDSLEVTALAALPEALRTRVIHRHAIATGCPPADLAAVHVAEVERLVTDWHGQGPLDLPGRVSVTRQGSALVFSRPERPA